MKTKIPKEGWYKVGQEALAHLVYFGEGTYTEFYCGKETSSNIIKHDKNCFNRCWRCIEAYERKN